MYIDTHAHIIGKYYDDVLKEIEYAKNENVKKILNVGTFDKEFDEVISLSKQIDGLYSVIGYYPSMVDKCDDLSYLEKCLKQEDITAIGEIGLDYATCDHREEQIILFRKQIQLAILYDKPLVIHSRDAIGDTYEILAEYKSDKLRGVVHCYSGSAMMAKEFIKIGFSLGIGGVYTFKNNKTGIEVLKEIDLSNLVLETDAPYLTPHPFRGSKNSPKYIPYVANLIAQIKNISINEVMEVTTKNAEEIFFKDNK